jgi:hypothetical protein
VRSFSFFDLFIDLLSPFLPACGAVAAGPFFDGDCSSAAHSSYESESTSFA